MNWQPGGIISIRPSQQLFWKTTFASYPTEEPNTLHAFKPVTYVFQRLNGTNLLAQVVMNHIETGETDSASVRWFDSALEGNPEYNYAAKSSSFKTLMDKFPYCHWCHTPIKRHIGVWEHKREVTPWYVNNWGCITSDTSDGKWHVATHPFYGTKSIESKMGETLSPQFFAPVGLGKTIVVDRYHEPGFEVIEVKKGRKFKTF
jgi:hypothetical protein